MTRPDDPADVMALIEATAEERVPHLEPRVTARDEADLAVLRGRRPRPERRVNVVGLALSIALVVLLVLMGVAVGLIVTAIAAAADSGAPVTLTEDLDPLWRAMIALAALALVWQVWALVRAERQRRRRGGGRR